MANPHRADVALKAGDAEYILRYTSNGICELEALFGKGINVLVDQIQTDGGASFEMTRAFVWAALRKHHPTMNMEAAGDLLDDVGLVAMMEKVGEALTLFFPQADPAGNVKKAPASR